MKQNSYNVAFHMQWVGTNLEKIELNWNNKYLRQYYAKTTLEFPIFMNGWAKEADLNSTVS